MKQKVRLAAFFLLPQLAVCSSRAQGASSGWVEADPAGAVSKDNPATVDRITFGNQFQNQGMDQWCNLLPLIVPLSQDSVQGRGSGSLLMGGTFAGMRQFLRYPDGSLALNDQLEIKFQTGYSRTLIEGLKGGVQKSLGVYGGASIDGQSIVTRPLYTADSCSEIKRLMNILDFKTVLPLNADRISKMEVGELWEIPLVYQIAFEPLDLARVEKTSLPVAPFSAYLSIGLSKTSDPTITLFRLSPKALRLKIHFDQFKAVNASGGAFVGPIPATDIGTPGTESLLSALLPNIISNPILKLFTREIDDYLAAQISILMSGQRGHQIFLEYQLDPDNQDQMQLLSQFLKGDLGVLSEMKELLVDWKDISHNSEAQNESLILSHRLPLRVPEAISGLDSYRRSINSLNFSIPFLINYSGSVAKSEDHYVIEFPQREEFLSYKVQKQSNWGFLKPPLLGSVLRLNRSQSVQALLPISPSVKDSRSAEVPLVVYNSESGILRSGSINGDLTRIGSLVSSIGSLDENSTAVQIPAPALDLARGSNHKGYVELSVILTTQAVSSILSASALSVIRAFQLSLDGSNRKIFNYALNHAEISGDGDIRFKNSFVSHLDELRLADPVRERLSVVLSAAGMLCREVKLIVDDISRARSLASSPEARASALAQILAGASHRWFDSYPSYGEMMRILLRLAPENAVAADLVLHVDKEKTSSLNPTHHYLLHPEILSAEALRSMSAIERAFMPPTPLND